MSEVETNLLSPSQVRQLLARHGLHPKKRLGQNFLIDRNVLRKILDAAQMDAESNVLEIGPGLGTLTKEIAQTAADVIAIEADRDLIPVLEETLTGYQNVDVIRADFMDLDLRELLNDKFGDRRCIVVANLPYYITSPIIIKLINVKDRIERMVFTVQEEVAERLTAAPATPEYGSLTVLVQYHCLPMVVAKAKRTVFYPSPEVDSTVIRLDVRPSPAVSVPDEELFFKIVRASFGQRRKTLVKSLSGSPDLGWTRQQAEDVLEKAEIDPVRRGETLSLEEFARITTAAVG